MRKYPSLELVKSQVLDKKPKLSLGVRVKNEIEAIKYFWESIKKQSYFEYLEIVFLDSGSDDGTIDFIKSLNCFLYTISPDEFSFGDTCNLLMELTTCEYVCFFSGHVILEQNNLFKYVLEFTEKNPDTSGYFRQIPNHLVGCNIYDSTFLKYKFPTYSDSHPLLIKSAKNGFSNAASLIFRKHWKQVPFRDIIASEDFLWAKEAIEKNLNVFYFHMLNVEHSHQETLENIYKRVRINALARFPKGVSQIQIYLMFMKIFFAVFLNSYKISDSFRYANTHSSAYKNLKNQK